jgi:REP element-mobilizing transposase RayT
VHVPGGHYHVTLRGNHRHALFARPRDRERLDEIAADALERYTATLRAYCWMTNHLHLLVQVADVPLSRTMQWIAARYARYFQRSFGTTGHLFERRHHAVLVEDDGYLLELVRYIHLNPVRGGLVAHAADYEWSSHRTYMGLAARRWVSADGVLKIFGHDEAAARDAYVRFVQAGEAGVLGILAGVASVGEGRLQRAPPVAMRTPAPTASGTIATLEDLIVAVCRAEGCLPQHLAAPGREPRFVRLRTRIAEEATALGLASMTEIARRFNRTPASVSWSLKRRRSPERAEVT